ncbi:MAG TPA: bifunctional nuclease family protein [Candidatus Dormibacteraeota bacterium]
MAVDQDEPLLLFGRAHQQSVSVRNKRKRLQKIEQDAGKPMVRWARFRMAKFVEMQVDSIRVHMPSGQHVVILKEKETDRYLPIWIGIYEANAIALKITGITPERPITHDLVANILQSAEMRLKKIQVTSLTNEVFFARLFLAVNGKEVEIDSRPSDAIALAVRMTCPIMVSQDVLDKAGVFPEKEEEEEDAKLSIFKELINSMDLPDLEGPPPEKS